MLQKCFETNAVDYYEEFRKLTVDEMHRALKKGVAKALKKIQKEAVSNLKSNYNNTDIVNPKYNDTLASGIRVSKIKTNSSGVIEGVVRAHSNGKHGSGTYRLHFLEQGTRERYAKTRNGKPLKKHAYRGKIVARKFFKPAVDANLAIWDSIIEEEVEKAINKINNRK